MRKLVLVLFVLLPSLARADATDRLLEAAAEQALLRGDPTLALAWVPPGADDAARAAYENAHAVSLGGKRSREVATGYLAAALRRLRDQPPASAGIAIDPDRVEQALAGSLERRSSLPIRRLVERLSRSKLDRAIADLRRLADYASGDIPGARLYVRAYAALVGYTGRLTAAAAAPVSERFAGGPELHEQICACDCPDCEAGDCPPCTCICIGADPACPRLDEMTWIWR